MNWLLVFIGGGLGSIVRFFISQQIGYSKQFPWATLISNVIATTILAVFVYYLKQTERPAWLMPLIGVGFCGGFSTFSTFSLENYQLYTQGQWVLLGLNIVISIFGGFTIVAIVSKTIN